jgi:hypothetical protein
MGKSNVTKNGKLAKLIFGWDRVPPKKFNTQIFKQKKKHYLFR